jgi:hypothetical protein
MKRLIRYENYSIGPRFNATGGRRLGGAIATG